MTRSAAKERTTKETSIAVRLDLDGPAGAVSASTGLPFFDHMLDQLGRHGGFDLDVQAKGDLHVDGHHTVEDVGITVGEVFREALGDKAGIRRFASGLYPLDEAYGQFAPWSALELVDDSRPLVVTRTYSKTWSMAGARLGYLVGPRALVAQLDQVVLPYHLDSVKQAAGRIALDFDDAMRTRVAGLVEERGRLVGRLSELPVTVWPSAANFVLFRPDERDGAAVWQALLDHSVLVRDCSSWPRLDGCLRVTIGTTAEDDAFLTALEETLA